MLIRHAADARKLNEIASPLILSPGSYSDSLDAFIAEYVVPNLPSGSAVEEFHSALTSYVAQPDSLYLVRAVSGMECGTVYATGDGTAFRATDNAPAWWVHSVLVHGGQIDEAHFAQVISTIPARLFDVGRSTPRTASSAGWHIAHLLQVKDGNTDYRGWSRPEVVRRFVRSVHPCNYFPIAKQNWAQWGGDERVLANMAALFSERYETVWADFLELAQCKLHEVSDRAGDVIYNYGPAVLESDADDPAVHIRDRPRLESIAEPHGTAQVEYHASRLMFRRDVIEALTPDDCFRIVTPAASYLMSRAEFEEAFPNVVRSHSYRIAGLYHYPSTPRRAEVFRE